MTEMEKLKSDYDNKCEHLEEDLVAFIKQHRAEIKKLRDTELKRLKNTLPSDELAIKIYIIKTQSINPIDEIKLELDEIEKEVWYQGEKKGGPVDRNKVAEEWCKRHAPGWRDQWVLFALLTFERHKEKYLALLNETT